MVTRTRNAVDYYLTAKAHVLASGFEYEIAWQESRAFRLVSERELLSEAAWVILSSGFRYEAVAGAFPMVSRSFGGLMSAEWICRHRTRCEFAALKHFGHHQKIRAIGKFACHVATNGVAGVVADMEAIGPESLRHLPFMGPVTSIHLAKNIGFPIPKPDRHLVRIAAHLGFTQVDTLCTAINDWVGDSVQVVDLVLWRYAVLVRAVR